MASKFKVAGLRDLDRALSELGTKAQKQGVLQRIGKQALEPMRQAAQAAAPVKTGNLETRVAVKSGRTRRAKRNIPRSRRIFKGGRWVSTPKTNVTIAMGPTSGTGALNYAAVREFGMAGQRAHPFMRPAWDGYKQGAFNYVKSNLGDEIMRTAERAARRARRKAKA